MGNGLWVIRLILILLGVTLLLRGVYLKEKGKEAFATSGCLAGDSFLGCLVGLIIGLIFAGFLRFMPLWFVKTLWILLGVGFILLGILAKFT